MTRTVLLLQYLPNEVLCQIIAGLETKNDIRGLLFTNKLFQELVYYSWSKLTLRYDNKLDYHAFLSLPADRLHYLLELDISNCDRMTNGLFNQILAKTPNLQILRMKKCKRLDRAAFPAIIRKLPSLLALDIRGFDGGEIVYFDGDYNHNHLDQLTGTTLPLREFRGDEAIFNKLASKGCIVKDNITTLVFGTQLDIAQIKTFVNIRVLKFDRTWTTRNWDLTGCVPQLEKLKLGAIDSLILGNRPNLTYLSFTAEPKFVGATLWPDIKNLKSLKIQISEHSKDTTFSLKLFPKLEELTINRYEVKELKDHQILKKLSCNSPYGGNILDAIAANPSLTDLRLPNLTVTNEALDVLSKLKYLKRLVVAHPFNEEICGSTKWGKLTALKELTVTPQFQYKTLWHSGLKHIPNLEVLKLNVAYEGLNKEICALFPQQIKEGFKSLKRLVIGGGLGASYFTAHLDSRHFKHLNYIKTVSEKFTK